MSDTTWINSTETKSGIAHSSVFSSIVLTRTDQTLNHRSGFMIILYCKLHQPSRQAREAAAARNILCCGAASFGVGRSTMSKPTRDKPWIMRTYAGHSTAAKSNELYRTNLARGQTGLSVAFDLPTQTGYDSDHPLAKGEVGKVGVPVAHLGDMRTLFDGIPLERMNTSMTINAPAAWLLALYIATAEGQGVERAKLQGTTQNDIIKEYLSRGTYIFPPEPSLRLTADTIGFTYREV